MRGMDQARAGWIRDWFLAHRTPLFAVALALFCVLAAALGFSGVWSLYSLIPTGSSPWWSLLTALPACLLVLTKQRSPMLSLAAATVLFSVDLLTVGGLGPLIVLLDVLWTAAFQATVRGRAGILAASVAGSVALFGGALLAGAPWTVAFLVLLQFATFVGTDFWWAVAVAQAHELADLHRQRAEDAEAAADRDRAEAVRVERETMAKELHDVVAGHVLAMAIRAEAALSTPPDEVRDRDALRAVRSAGIDAHGALRSMIAVLRRGEGELSPTPRLADIDGIVDDARRAGLGIRLAVDELPGIAGAEEQTVVRIVRESLSNCVRHASGAEVDVAVRAADRAVRVRVRSRGGAGSAPKGLGGGGWGLSMLAERVEALGGEFSAGPVGDSWSVDAVIPIEARS